MLSAYCKASCYQFGHACFGAHGKRSDPEPRLEMTLPRSDFEDRENLIPSASDSESFLTDSDKENMEVYLRNWIEKLREEVRESPMNSRRQNPLKKLRNFHPFFVPN
ncbi:UNVERIFIED_CONTAM: hypothetical protein RMT77_005386 [Armadillidium vulgare]